MREANFSKHRARPATLIQARELRRDSAPAEKLLWQRLGNRQLNGLKFWRQVPIGRYVADFVNAQSKLVIELDGQSHLGKEVYDNERELTIASAGYRVVRFLNAEIFCNIEDVLSRISAECDAAYHFATSPHPGPLPGGEREESKC
jgi:very-short-patch-repair endonuclease